MMNKSINVTKMIRYMMKISSNWRSS